MKYNELTHTCLGGRGNLNSVDALFRSPWEHMAIFLLEWQKAPSASTFPRTSLAKEASGVCGLAMVRRTW